MYPELRFIIISFWPSAKIGWCVKRRGVDNPDGDVTPTTDPDRASRSGSVREPRWGRLQTLSITSSPQYVPFLHRSHRVRTKCIWSIQWDRSRTTTDKTCQSIDQLSVSVTTVTINIHKHAAYSDKYSLTGVCYVIQRGEEEKKREMERKKQRETERKREMERENIVFI